jgi:hypothetical protein
MALAATLEHEFDPIICRYCKLEIVRLPGATGWYVHAETTNTACGGGRLTDAAPGGFA